MDDKHVSSLARPGSTVTPAVLAVAQANNMSLNDVVTAVTVGYEVMIRLGFVGGERFLERGYHTRSLHGAWGAHSGIVALDLATAGITGPSTVFEGKFGFFNCFLTPITGQLDFARAAAGLR